MTTIPRPRSDLLVRDLADALAIADPATGQSVHLGSESSAVWVALAAGHDTPTGLTVAVPSLSPAVIRLRLQQLRESLLLDGSLWATARPLFQGAEPTTAELPLRLSPTLQHRCIGCGGSCTGAEIGPVPEVTLTTIEEHRLFAEVEGAESAAGCVTARPYGEAVSHFMTRAEGRCVMLTAERRCAVHAAGGRAAKPGVCQQFPYTFTRSRDAIYVSLQMECRSLSAALDRGAAEDHDTLLAELRPLAEGPLVHVLPDPVRLAPGIYLDQASYLRWWDLQDGLSLDQIAANAVGLAQAHGLGDEPEWLRAAHWGAPLAIAPAALRARLWQHVTRAVALMTQEAAKEGRLVEQEQAELLRKALLVAGGHVPVGAVHWLDDAGPALMGRVVSAAMAGHDMVRDSDLLYGLGRLHLVRTLTLAAARLRAVPAGRVALTAQDVNDALVATNVILRTPYVEQTLRMADAAVRSFAQPESVYAPWMGVPHPALLEDGPVSEGR